MAAATGRLRVPQFIGDPSTTTFENGEIVYSVANKTLIAGDGATAGGTVMGGYTAYTINGAPPDATGNFALTPESIGAAKLAHTHVISDLPDLQPALDGKAPIDHTHQLVSGITVGAVTLSDAVTLAAGSNVRLTLQGSEIVVNVDPTTTSAAVSAINIATADGSTVQQFIGTQAAWDAFTKVAGVKYLAYIVGA